ncbi:hypothetical protein C6A85_09155, partial [Mycobacterium sp. ITM-2017-0098]
SAAGDLDLQDLAYTLARRRAHRTVRTAVLAGDADELLTALRAVTQSASLIALARNASGDVADSGKINGAEVAFGTGWAGA